MIIHRKLYKILNTKSKFKFANITERLFFKLYGQNYASHLLWEPEMALLVKWPQT